MVLAFRTFLVLQPPAVHAFGVEAVPAVGVSGYFVLVAQVTDVVSSYILHLLLLLWPEAFTGILGIFRTVIAEPDYLVN